MIFAKRTMAIVALSMAFMVLGSSCSLLQKKPSPKNMIPAEIAYTIQLQEYDKAQVIVMTTLPDYAEMQVRLFNEDAGFDESKL